MLFKVKSFLAAIATFGIVAIGLTLFPLSVASAAAVLALSSSDAVAGERLSFTGRLPTHMRRPVQLQSWSGSRWTVVAKSSSSSSGGFTLVATMPSGTKNLRAYAPKTSKAKAQTTTTLRVVPRSQSGSVAFVPASVGQSKAGSTNLTPVDVHFTPVRAGRPVSLQRLVDGSWVELGTVKQNSKGLASFLLTVPHGDVRPYRAIARAYNGAVSASTPWMRPNQWTRVFSDDFVGTALDPAKWTHRLLGLRHGMRQCAESSTDAVSVSGGLLSIVVKQVPTAEREKSVVECPYGEFKNGMIGTGARFDFKHGILSARIRFPHATGQHGSLFSQPATTDLFLGDPKRSGAEIDVVEYYGDGRPQGGLSHLIHWRDKDENGKEKLSSSGGVTNSDRLLQEGRAWSDDFHVYSVEWTPTKYIFRIDGNETFRTERGVSGVNQYLILSLLTSDWEIPRLDMSKINPMSVDWVRVWQG